ncbi:helix-turn-helix transcriptional regulator [Parabacteroides sp. AF48-14]|uniref:S24 family peptidase n=1 Tax=Parabacteroides sp. AF48-14 TaxID=2292052 RepID=UPI000F00E55D|nr:S24 family peptidase [Parabacteroides sp. AF48-14]RHO73392.1 helix-turn-helix transcriptional regulator [Parabacteroides sp. AF48-14]
MNTILQRIEKIAINEGIKITAFEKSIGASKGVLSRAIANGTDIQSKWLQAIVENYPRYSEEWLLAGRGSMLKECVVKREAPKIDILARNDDFVRIPIVDISVAAGTGCYNPDYLEEVECISLPRTMIKDGHTYLCVRIKGQSMTPSLLDGGHLVIRLLDKTEWDGIRDNYVYVVSDNEGRAFVKRLKNRLHQHGFIVCMSDNVDKQNYGNFNLYEEELNTVWFAEWYFTAKIPNIQETYYRKQAELEDKFEDLAQQVRQLTQAINMHN